MAALRIGVIMACLALTSRGFLLDDNSLQNLLNLISEEKKLRASAEQEINQLKSDIANMRANHQPCKFFISFYRLFKNIHFHGMGPYTGYNRVFES